MLLLALLLEILLHIAKGCLISYGLDGACLIYIVLAEQHLRVFVGYWLINAGEVQIDIRHLIAIKAQKDRKGNIVPILDKPRTADRAVLVGQVVAAAVGAIRNEMAVLAVGAAIMRRQWIDLRDAGHGRNKGRTYRATGTNQIAVIIGFLDQSLGNQVEHRETMPDDWFQFLLQPCFHDFRQILAVHAFRLVVGHGANFIICARYHRRIQIIRDGLEILYHIRDFARVGNYCLISQFLAQIIELRQHLLRGAQVQGRLLVRIRKALALHQDGTIDIVLLVQEMHITGGYQHFAQLPGQLRHLQVDPAQIIVGIDIREFLAALQEVIIVDGLDFQIIIKRRNLYQLLLRRPGHDGANQLPRLAGRAYQDTLAEFLDNGLRQARLAMEIFHMGKGDHLVKIAQAIGILRQKDDMVRMLLLEVTAYQISFHAVNNLDIQLFLLSQV